MRASKRAPDRVYIDGFAGGGKGVDPTAGEEYDGSAALAFAVDPPFTGVFLIEQDEGRVGLLRELAAQHPSAQVLPGDVNVEVPKLLRYVNPKAPTLAFLDPEGTQLHWKTLEVLAAHKRGHSKTKIELLILFPLQMAMLRLRMSSYALHLLRQSEPFARARLQPGVDRAALARCGVPHEPAIATQSDTTIARSRSAT